MRTGGSGVRFYDGPDIKLFILVGWDRSSFVYCLVHRGSTDDLLLQISSGIAWQSRDFQMSSNTLYLLGHRHCYFIVLPILVIFPFTFESLIWVLIASVPGLCILFTFKTGFICLP